MSAQVVANILSSGDKLREYAKGVENNLRKVELDSIQVTTLTCDTLWGLLFTLLSCIRFFPSISLGISESW